MLAQAVRPCAQPGPHVGVTGQELHDDAHRGRDRAQLTSGPVAHDADDFLVTQRPAIDVLLQQAVGYVVWGLLAGIAADDELLFDVAIEFDCDLRHGRTVAGARGLVILADPLT